MGCAMQNHRVSKKQNHVPLANVLKARKSEMMMQNQYMNQNINTSNMGNMYGNHNFQGMRWRYWFFKERLSINFHTENIQMVKHV